MKKRGRKKIVIDWKSVDKSLKAGANGVQVAAKLGIHYDTLVNTFKIDFPSTEIIVELIKGRNSFPI